MGLHRRIGLTTAFAIDRSAGRKHDVARDLVRRLWETRHGCLSLQVLQELFVTATRKLGPPPEDAARQIDRLGLWTIHRPGHQDVIQALEQHRSASLSFWAALEVRSASVLGCGVLCWEEPLPLTSRPPPAALSSSFLSEYLHCFQSG